MKDLRSFLAEVKALGPAYYREIKKPIGFEYELTVLQLKLARDGFYPVLYAAQVNGSNLPVVSGLFGDYGTMGIALGLTPESMARDGHASVLAEYVRRQPDFKPIMELAAKDAPAQEEVLTGDAVNLLRLPVQKHAAHNRGRFVTAGATITRDPDSGTLNAGVYRQLVLGPNRYTCKMVASHDGAHNVEKWHRRGKAAPVVTFIGHHPATLIAAGFSLEAGRSELEYMGALLGEPLAVVPGRTVDLPVPAHAEIAIEGEIRPGDMDEDALFSEARGTYDSGPSVPVISVSAITMRRDAIYQDLCPVHPEHTMLNVPGREMTALARVRAAVPGVQALHVGPDGDVTKIHFYVSIKKKTEGDAAAVARAVMQATEFAKFIVVVDADIDIFHQPDVLWALTTRFQDPSQASHFQYGRGTLSVIDATCRLDQPFQERALPPAAARDSITLRDYLA